MNFVKLFLAFACFLLMVSCAPFSTPAPVSTPTETAIPAPTSTATVSPTPTPKFPIGTTITSTKDGMIQHSIPAGEFRMGTLEDGEWISENEMPQHVVYLDGFWMDETEVTNAQYGKCVQGGVCTPPHRTSSYSKPEYYGNPEFDNFPVIFADWSQAKAYCEWAGRRLPTEAEWEKAARGMDARLYPWPSDKKGNYFANFTFYDNEDPVAVKTYMHGVSPYGIYEMSGNVYEWVADWYSATYYSESPRENPLGPESGLTRVMRGGGWSSDWIYIRTASRMHFYPQDFSSDIGFRCAQSQ